MKYRILATVILLIALLIGYFIVTSSNTSTPTAPTDNQGLRLQP